MEGQAFFVFFCKIAIFKSFVPHSASILASTLKYSMMPFSSSDIFFISPVPEDMLLTELRILVTPAVTSSLLAAFSSEIALRSVTLLIIPFLRLSRLQFIALHYCKICKNYNTKHDSIPAKYLEVMLLDKVHQEPDHKYRYNKGCHHTHKKNCKLHSREG